MVMLLDCWLPEDCSGGVKTLGSTLKMKTQTQKSIERPKPSQYQLHNSHTSAECLILCICKLFKNHVLRMYHINLIVIC